MKWKDLSLKERKQIYDSVRVNNPDATYFDIKEQFDSIPTYEDGKGKTINKADLPPEYITGTPEYFERQRKISGAVNAVQPEAYITPAGYIKDAVNFIEDLGKGDYAGAAIDAALNLLPWGVGKGIKKLKSRVGRILEGTDTYTAESFNPTPTITKKRGMQKEGLINNWTDPITQDKIEEYLSYRSKYANRVNPVLRTLYDIRPDKQGFINRMNNLTPIEWAVPLGLPMFFGEEQENK